MRKIGRFLAQNLNQCNFFLPKFGYHGNSLGSLDNFDSIFEFTSPENRTKLMHAKNLSISCRELKSVQFCFFCPNLVVMATPLTTLNFR